RTPVRRALGRLAADGLLVRRPGRGTHVAVRPPGHRPPASVEVVTATVLTEDWCWPLQRAAAQLMDDQPGRQIKLQFNVAELPLLHHHLARAVAHGQAPDVSIIDSVRVAEFARRGYLWPLDQIDPSAAAMLTADLLPPLRAANTYHGELFALPVEADHSLLWYRLDWLEAEGLAPPRTWDEWLDCLLRFRSPVVHRRHGLGPYPLAFCAGAAAGETATYQLLPLLWSAGADVITGQEIVLHSEAAIAAVGFAADLVQTHRVAAPDVLTAHGNAPALALAAGTVAFALGGSYESSLIRAAAGWSEREFRDRIGMLPMPAGPHGQPASIMGGVSYGILRQSRQPALAFDLLTRTLRPENWGSFGAERGVNPPTISANAELDPAANPLAHDAMTLLPYGRERWPLADYPRVSAQIVQMFETALAGLITPVAAVERAAAVISGITGLPEQGARWSTRHPAQYPLVRIS
ncbi:MAG: extracellular solute-binding protein, partial [Chloroflexia bacterium]|nr:extracellular solute-binding protein [Chloroflexia bacterium]